MYKNSWSTNNNASYSIDRSYTGASLGYDQDEAPISVRITSMNREKTEGNKKVKYKPFVACCGCTVGIGRYLGAVDTAITITASSRR